MIRLATYNDLEELTKVHKICFPDSYSSQLTDYKSVIGGGNLLLKFYRKFLDKTPELFFVACDENSQIVGLCMGYYMDDDTHIAEFMQENRLGLIWKSTLKLLSGSQQVWKKISGTITCKFHKTEWIIINHKYEHIPNNEIGDLLSVCVLPEYRGQGYAQQLMDAFLSAMNRKGRKLCLLSVRTDNTPARKFYERNGFEVYRTLGSDVLTYIKPLPNYGSDNVSTQKMD